MRIHRVVFTRTTFTPDGQARVAIHTIDPTGTGERLLIEDAGEPAWSPDGTSIVFTSIGADDHSPTWAPDGQRIAFVSDRSNRADHENEIYVIGADGSGLLRLTTNDVWDLEPAWR